MADKLISKIPDGPLAEKWTKRKSELRLVNPNNRRKLEIIVVGTVFSMIPSREATTAAVKPMYIVWRKSVQLLSTSVSHREFLLPVNMADILPTAPSEVYR